MDNYPEFRSRYIRLVTEMLNEPVGTGDDGAYIGTPRLREICSELADLDELHPDWVVLVEDSLAERHLLQ